MKRFSATFLLLALAFFVILPFGAIAQVGPSGTMNAVIIDGAKNTYGVARASITPYSVASPTDVVAIFGATGSTVRIKKVTVSGIAASAGSMDVSLVKRTTADSAGTLATTGSPMTAAATNITYTTGTVSGANFSSVVWGSGTQTAKVTLSGLTVGTPYVFTFTPTVTGQVPTVTASTGVGTHGPIATVVTATVENIQFIPSATSAIFLFSNTTTSSWSTASTTCYATLPAIAKYDSTQVAAKSWVAEYTVNPTVGTGIAVRNKTLNFGVAGAAGTVTFDFMTQNDKPLLLLNGNQGLAINLNQGNVPTTGKLSYDIEWEESSP